MAAESILSAFLPAILDKLISPAIHQLLVAFGEESDLQKLKRVLIKIQTVLVDAEERQTADHSIQAWLSNLKNLSFEAEDVLEEFEFEDQRNQRLFDQANIMRRKVLSYCSQFTLCRRLNDIVQKIEKIADEINKFNFQFNKAPQISYCRPQTHSYVDKEIIVGREKDKDEIVSFLINFDFNNKKDIAVLPIVGMGGMGKTTLSQLVYSDCRVEDHFQLRMWVCVSDADFDVARIVRLIIEAATKEECKLPNMELLQHRLREKISGKRYLIVLDDVWNEDRIMWEKLKILLDCGGEGSTVVVSTRSVPAAKMMANKTSIHYLEQLSERDGWELFRRRAFVEGEEEPERLVKIGKDITNRCCGLPLAIDTLGSMMRDENDEEKWKAVLNSEIWKMQAAKDNILPALRLSYNYLPPHLKQCFAFCAIYPKGYEMERDTLIHLWMANGYIPYDGKGDMEIMGRDIFDQLVWRSFLQNVKEVRDYYYPNKIYGYRGIVTCKMNDLMHDLVRSIMGKECFNFADTPMWEEIPSTARYLLMPSLPKSSHSGNQSVFRTLFMSNFSLRLKSLRVLKLCLMASVISVRHLKHLRLLDLSSSDIMKVPQGICSLYNLQILKLSDCRMLKKLPDNLTDLMNLRHLYIDGCYKLACMPSQMRRLKHLHTLTMYVVNAEAGRGLEELRDLNLYGTLELRGIEKVLNAIDAQHANLSSKKNLHSLKLYSEGADSIEVFEALKPHDGLKMLEVWGYRGEQFPKWINMPQHLNNLVQIKLHGCKKCKEVPPLGHLPFLEVLELFDIDEVKHIINKTIWCNEDLHTTFFPSLKELHIGYMKNLESLPERMESLTSLSIKECNRLISLPEDLTKLDKLFLTSCNFIESLPQGMGNLFIMYISNCNKLILLPEDFTKLDTLFLESYNFIESLSQGLENLINLCFYECNRLISLPEDLTKVDNLTLIGCHHLESLPQGMRSLSRLSILRCNRLMSLPHDLTNLDTLDLCYCNSLKSLPEGMENLRILKVSKCKGITSLPEDVHVQLSNLSSLTIIGHDELIRPYQFGGDYWHLIENIPNKDIRLDEHYHESFESWEKSNVISLLRSTSKCFCLP